MDEIIAQAAPRNPKEFPFVVLGNKSDLAKTKRQVNNHQNISYAYSLIAKSHTHTNI